MIFKKFSFPQKFGIILDFYRIWEQVLIFSEIFLKSLHLTKNLSKKAFSPKFHKILIFFQNNGKDFLRNIFKIFIFDEI